MHLPLYEIKRKLQIKNNNHSLENSCRKTIGNSYNPNQTVKKRFFDLLPIIDQYKKDPMSKKLNEEGSALIESLLKITS